METPNGKVYHIAHDIYEDEAQARTECHKLNCAAGHPSRYPFRFEYWVEQNPDGKYQIYAREYNVCDL